MKFEVEGTHRAEEPGPGGGAEEAEQGRGGRGVGLPNGCAIATSSSADNADKRKSRTDHTGRQEEELHQPHSQDDNPDLPGRRASDDMR